MKKPELNMSAHLGADIISVSPMTGGVKICVQSCVPQSQAEVDRSTLQYLPVNSRVVEAWYRLIETFFIRSFPV